MANKKETRTLTKEQREQIKRIRGKKSELIHARIEMLKKTVNEENLRFIVQQSQGDNALVAIVAEDKCRYGNSMNIVKGNVLVVSCDYLINNREEEATTLQATGTIANLQQNKTRKRSAPKPKCLLSIAEYNGKLVYAYPEFGKNNAVLWCNPMWEDEDEQYYLDDQFHLIGSIHMLIRNPPKKKAAEQMKENTQEAHPGK